jgi:hypothetical protein
MDAVKTKGGQKGTQSRALRIPGIPHKIKKVSKGSKAGIVSADNGDNLA